MSGSHMLPSYYGMRRPFISDSDFAPSTKQFSPDAYPSAFGGRPLGCETSSFSLIDTYHPDAFSEYRNTSATFSGSGGTFLPSSAISSLLPPFSGESSHVYMRDSWEQSIPEAVPQVDDLCSDNLASVTNPSSMPSPESQGSPPQPGQGPDSGSQPYALHPLEDAHYHLLTSSNSFAAPPSSFPCPPYVNNDLAPKMVAEAASDGHAGLPLNMEAHASWDKEDGVSCWSPYELRRAY
ncbi:POU domain class 2-associating factor 2 isoform X2 [Festucalex cinctus]